MTSEGPDIFPLAGRFKFATRAAHSIGIAQRHFSHISCIEGIRPVTAEDPEEVAVNFLVTTFEILVEKMDEKRVLAAKLLIVLHIVAVNKRIKQDGIIQYQLMLAIPAEVRQQEQSSRQSFLAGIKQLVDQVLPSADCETKDAP